MSQKKDSPKTNHRFKLIFNPHAGKKRQLFNKAQTTALEDIKSLLEQYQIEVDYFPTKAPGHATTLAKESVKEGYEKVLVAGGDGTAGEVANGLVGTDVTLGILPLGSFMNIARMLSIPQDLEKAILLIKTNRVRKIDLGCVTRLSGEKLDQPHYFIESVGIGLEAQLHENVLEMERGHRGAFFKIFKTITDYYGHATRIIIDGGEEIRTHATLVNISNGPYSGAALPLAAEAKLNDHRLTVSLYKMSKFELVEYFFSQTIGINSWITKKLNLKRRLKPKITTYDAKEVKIFTKHERLVHADARVFATTPIELKIVPNALNVITGFPSPSEKSALVKRTILDP